MWHVLKSNYKDFSDKIVDLLTKRPKNKKEESGLYNELMSLTLSLITGTTQGRFSQWLNITDSTFINPSESLEISLAKVKGARRDGKLQILYETVKPGVSFEMEVLKVKSRFSEKEMLEIAHNFYQKVLEHDNTSINKEPYLLRLGQGSTAYSTSLLILAQELGIKNYRINPPRTRKRIDDTLGMGWVRVTF